MGAAELSLNEWLEGICLIRRTVKQANHHPNSQTGRDFQIRVERNRKGRYFTSVKKMTDYFHFCENVTIFTAIK